MSYGRRSSAFGLWLVGVAGGAALVLGIGRAVDSPSRAAGPGAALAHPTEDERLALALGPTTPAELRELLRRMNGAGADEAPGLRRLALESADPVVAGNALRALARLGLVARDDELLALLNDPRPRMRQEVVRALAISPDPAARERLDALARSCEDVELRALAGHVARALPGP